MSAFYNRILYVLEATDQLEDAIKALQWLCLSDHPFRVTEMVEILAIDIGDNATFNPEERLPDPMDIMVVCSSLISFHPTADNQDENAVVFGGSGRNADRIQVQLAHFSGTEQWWQHLRASEGVLDDALLSLILRILTEQDACLLPWLQVFDIDVSWSGLQFGLKAEDLARPPHYAARIGVPAVVDKTKGPNTDANAQGGFCGNALCMAPSGGHETIVEILVYAKADVNAQGGHYGNALCTASSQGHKKILQIVIDTKADVNAQGGKYGNALCAASFNGHDSIVQMLLNAGADLRV
ncbi:hypothetical protein LTS15_005663 [Exophiala xenobiotica]|nr:hypothetical protein LTS15_005663 [Exophiala xenobiotica]